MGDVATREPVLVRVHSQCLTGDLLGSLRCDCGDQMEIALERIASEGRGAFVYMAAGGAWIGLHNKIRAYALQDEGMDTVEANLGAGLPGGPPRLRDRDADPARPRHPQDPAVDQQPAKRHGLSGYGLEVEERLPIEARPNPHNIRYLATKQEKMGHLLEDAEVAEEVSRGRAKARDASAKDDDIGQTAG